MSCEIKALTQCICVTHLLCMAICPNLETPEKILSQVHAASSSRKKKIDRR